MEGQYKDFAEWTATAIDIFGVVVIATGVIVSTVLFIQRWRHSVSVVVSYRLYRQHLGRSLLLGLELLVAADIIKTVAVDQTIESLSSLGLLVLIRTFLSFTLDMEVDGKLPWQRSGN